VLHRADVPASAMGLGALPQLVAEGNATGLRISLHLDVRERTLTRQAEHACYRVVQEGLNNVRKHAPDSEVTVECVTRGGEVCVSVTNTSEGRRMSTPAGPRVGAGYGLVGLKERVDLVGGALSSGPTADGGFALVVRIPCRETESGT
jgi:signal transduction histidine kinase